MRKVKVMFPRVEAGLGHIMPCNAVEQVFSKKYGDKVEVINQNIFYDNNNPILYRYGKWLSKQVDIYSKHPLIGHFASFNCALWGVKLATWASIVERGKGADKEGIKIIDELKPDLVFSTHWVTNYYAIHSKCRPISIVYCPDSRLNNLFRYQTDHLLISSEVGYFETLKSGRYRADKLMLVPNCIRNEAYQVNETKEESRKKLNIPNDKFVVVMAEGGYGNGIMTKVIQQIIKLDLNVTLVPICGKNKKTLDEINAMEHSSNVTLLPQGFVTDIFSYINAADIFCGKAGNMIGEPTFFGVPSIITSTSQVCEVDICDYYVNVVKSSIKEFNPTKVAKLIGDFINDPSLLTPYKEAALKHHYRYGAERTADYIWEVLVEKFPELLEK